VVGCRLSRTTSIKYHISVQGIVFGTQLFKFRVDKCSDKRRSVAPEETLEEATQPLLSFKQLWPSLQKQGWKHQNGRGLISWIYLRPGARVGTGTRINIDGRCG
jgi:hypothetical protein